MGRADSARAPSSPNPENHNTTPQPRNNIKRQRPSSRYPTAPQRHRPCRLPSKLNAGNPPKNHRHPTHNPLRRRGADVPDDPRAERQRRPKNHLPNPRALLFGHHTLQRAPFAPAPPRRSDIVHQPRKTCQCPVSIKPVARILFAHPRSPVPNNDFSGCPRIGDRKVKRGFGCPENYWQQSVQQALWSGPVLPRPRFSQCRRPICGLLATQKTGHFYFGSTFVAHGKWVVV